MKVAITQWKATINPMVMPVETGSMANALPMAPR
jgi:hypothetical protein